MKEIEKLINELTVEEKAALLEGVNSWNTNKIPRLDIPSLFLTDGPHGLRKVRTDNGGFGISDNQHSTAFPTSVTVASSWNIDNAYIMGEAIAKECITEGVDVLLAPGINIKRSPLCGRNFEYYSEDPFVSGEFGTAFVNGVQSMGVGCSVKHFAANSNENYRFTGDSVVDERALREIYLKAFEKTVKQAKPYTMMCSYNKLNGTFASQNKKLLNDILRDEWGFDGLVMTDWGAACDRVKGVVLGCDLDMPGSVIYNRNSIIQAVNSNELSMEDLNLAVTRILELINKCSAKKSVKLDTKKHAELSCQIAKDSAVLLKNDGVLPLTGKENLLVVGEMFEKMRYQGAGSSLINPPDVISPKDAFDNRSIKYRYQKGYRCFYSERDVALEKAALGAAEKADTILFFGGLTDFEESEGFDRDNMRIGDNQASLLDKLIASGKKIVFIMYTGSPIEIPFYEGLSGLLNMYLPGMHGGEATAALLYGESNPSGKLAESWTMTNEDTSCFSDYNKSRISKYYESIYVGYRFYDKAKTTLRFPFGYGLSYTSFEYSNISIDEENNKITVSADIENIGSRDGAEVIQLYVKNAKSEVFKAEKELRAFDKIFIKVGETKKVSLSFKKNDLAYWNVKENDWVLENGTYEIYVASSAYDIRLTAEFCITDGRDIKAPYTKEVTKAYWTPPKVIPKCFDELLGYKNPEELSMRPYTLDSSLGDFKQSFMGKVLFKSIMFFIKKDFKKAMKMPDSLERDTKLKNSYFLVRMMPSNSIRSMAMSSSGQFTYNAAVGLVEIANGHIIKGLKIILKKEEILNLTGEE